VSVFERDVVFVIMVWAAFIHDILAEGPGVARGKKFIGVIG